MGSDMVRTGSEQGTNGVRTKSMSRGGWRGSPRTGQAAAEPERVRTSQVGSRQVMWHHSSTRLSNMLDTRGFWVKVPTCSLKGDGADK